MDCKQMQKNIFIRTCVMMQQPYIQISRAARKKERKKEREEKRRGVQCLLLQQHQQPPKKPLFLQSTYIHTYIHTHYWLLLTATNCTEDWILIIQLVLISYSLLDFEGLIINLLSLATCTFSVFPFLPLPIGLNP